MDQIDDCLRLAKQCKLEYLENQLQMRLNSIQMFGTLTLSKRKLQLAGNKTSRGMGP